MEQAAKRIPLFRQANLMQCRPITTKRGSHTKNNELTDVGSLFWHSPGIFIWQSGSNLISSNHIYDQGYSGLIISGVRRRFFNPVFKKMGQGNPYTRWSFPKGARENLGAIRWDEISLESITEWSSYEPYMHARNNIIE